MENSLVRNSPTKLRTLLIRGEKGAELVEMAFVILLFVILVLGIFEFGRGYNIYQNITTAAREGARFAVAPARGGTMNYPNDTEVRASIDYFLRSANLIPSSATVNISRSESVDSLCACGTVGCPCGTNITISYPFSFLFFGNIQISTASTMRQES